jgi:hypothetical protein
MLPCTPDTSLTLILTYVLPPLGALLSATALWVASKARTTSEDVRLTSEDLLASVQPPPGQPERRVSLRAARDRRK